MRIYRRPVQVRHGGVNELPCVPGCVSSSPKREVTAEDGGKAACDLLSLAPACPSNTRP